MSLLKFLQQRSNSINRRLKIKYLLSGILLLIISACNEKLPEAELTLNDKLNFNPHDYSLFIEKSLNGDEELSTALAARLNYLDTLKQYYKTHDYKPLFVKSFNEQSFIDSLLIILDETENHGLDKEQYHFSIIKNEFDTVIGGDSTNGNKYKHLFNTELLVTDAILKYAYHMRYGIINPKEFYITGYTLPVADSASRILFEPLHQENIIQYLQDIQPKSKKYKQLQTALKHFRNYIGMEWEEIPVPVKKIEPGKTDSLIVQITGRLITLGFLDTTEVKIDDFAFYDSVIVNGVKAFQRANGLIDDGVIGKGTVDRLNTKPEEYVDKIKVNLERFRWIDYSDTARYILVNIPDFKLYAIENGEEKFDIKVCTGRKRYANYDNQYKNYLKTKNWRHKPEDWETPKLYSEISYLVLNPTWTVPISIMREEIAYKVRNDSNYLVNSNFKVLKNGVQIDPLEVKPSDLNAGSIPYTIIQNPGAGNALGKIKFMFNNPFGVYLHDTPTRPPFSQANRAVSHGCVRVEKPILLAEYILSNNSRWTIDYLKIETGYRVDNKASIEEFRQIRNELRRSSSYGPTTEVKLDKKIPLFIDYYTAWVDVNGVVNFREDVYNKDKKILEVISLTDNSDIKR